MNQNILTPAVPAFYFMNKKMVNALGQWQVHLHSKNEISLIIKKNFQNYNISYIAGEVSAANHFYIYICVILRKCFIKE